jgi:hypothetical protein
LYSGEEKEMGTPAEAYPGLYQRLYGSGNVEGIGRVQRHSRHGSRQWRGGVSISTPCQSANLPKSQSSETSDELDDTGLPIDRASVRLRERFLVVTPAERPNVQVFLLEQLASVVRSELVRERLMRAQSQQQVFEIIAAADPAVTG